MVVIVQSHASWITQANSTTIRALLSLGECCNNIPSKFPPKQTLSSIWSTAVITIWLPPFFFFFFLTKSLSDTLLSPLLKNNYTTTTRCTTHQQKHSWEFFCKIFRITQTNQFELHQITSPSTSEDVCPIILVTIIKNQAKGCELYTQNVSSLWMFGKILNTSLFMLLNQ